MCLPFNNTLPTNLFSRLTTRLVAEKCIKNSIDVPEIVESDYQIDYRLTNQSAHNNLTASKLITYTSEAKYSDTITL